MFSHIHFCKYYNAIIIVVFILKSELGYRNALFYTKTCWLYFWIKPFKAVKVL